MQKLKILMIARKNDAALAKCMFEMDRVVRTGYADVDRQSDVMAGVTKQ